MPTEIGFILKGYPRLSETFIAQEIHLLEKRGFAIRIYSMRAAREKTLHPVHGKIRAPVTYLPEDVFPSWQIVTANLAALRRFPAPYLGALAHAVPAALRRRSRSPVKRLLQAGWLLSRENLGRPGTSVRHLHSHFVHAPAELAFYLSRITGLPFSISAHAKDIYTSLPEEVRERVGAARFLMTCTHFNFERIREIVGPHEAHKINEVYHGVSLEAFRPNPAPAPARPRPRLLTVARLVEKKGYDDVFRAMVILRSRGISLHYDIFGSGELEGKVRGWIREHDLGAQVTLHGSVSQPRVLEAYREGGVFVLASRETASGDRDGIPNSLAEAMSMEMPVAATLVSGIPELVEHGVSGLLSPPGNPEALARNLERLYREPGLGADLGKRARVRVAAVFDAERCIDRCATLLAPFAREGSHARDRAAGEMPLERPAREAESDPVK